MPVLLDPRQLFVMGFLRMDSRWEGGGLAPVDSGASRFQSFERFKAVFKAGLDFHGGGAQ